MKQFIISLCFLCSYSAHAAKKPNIVFFFADDQTSSSLACYGHPLAKTPHIDKLAAKGTRFSNSYVSQAICWVSRTTILTGLTGRSYGTPGRHDAARPDAVKELYVDLLRKAGYRTGFAGKWHAKMPKGWNPADHFDVFQNYEIQAKDRKNLLDFLLIIYKKKQIQKLLKCQVLHLL